MKKVCAFCEMDIISNLTTFEIEGTSYTVCLRHNELLKLGKLEITGGQINIVNGKTTVEEKIQIAQLTSKNIDLSNMIVDENIVKEIQNYRYEGNKIYKFILLLSIIDYLEDYKYTMDNYFNRRIYLEEFVDYYRLYLENSAIKESVFNDKINKKILKKVDDSKKDVAKYNKFFIRNMQQNPIRHMHDSTFLFSDDIREKAPSGKYSRNAKGFANFVMLKKPYNIDGEVFINSIKVGAILKIRSILKNDNIVISSSRQRVGQDVYRRKLLDKYNCQCAICGESFIPMLVASHAKPWVKCESMHEQLSENNGLLLCSNHDTLFDRGYITIDPFSREIIINHQVSGHVIESTPKYYPKTVDDKMVKYLKYHQEKVFKGT